MLIPNKTLNSYIRGPIILSAKPYTTTVDNAHNNFDIPNKEITEGHLRSSLEYVQQCIRLTTLS